ncbi:MAG TPA: hypothetical protein DCG12_20730 [Planctomycetaceae bacterium]|nr:hypothetical protein [Planctomycetaceae bacterium]
MRIKSSLAIAVALISLQPVQAVDRLPLGSNDVVVFLGGANLLRQQQSGYLETLMTEAAVRQDAAGIRFRDFTWEADTVYRQGTVIERWRKDGWRRKGFGDLNEQLKTVKASLVIAQFGAMEALEGRQRLDDFRGSLTTLIEQLKTDDRRVVLITPTRFETPEDAATPDVAEQNGVLGEYVSAMQQVCAEQELPLVDLFHTISADLSDNGVHVRRSSQAIIAAEIARQLGLTETKVSADQLQKSPIALFGNRQQSELLRTAVVEKHRLWYDYWRPANWKLLYGDDAERQFTRGGDDYIPFKEEWKKLLPMVAAAEDRIQIIATGRNDTGLQRPKPETLHGVAEANVEEELKAFSVAEGLSVNLFASEADGLTSPLNLRWDSRGRMYVTVTTTYPHIFPGDIPNDKIIMLEDTDNDGVADQSTVFAEGLNIPTGIEIGNGGIYVGQNTEILFLKDTDNDGKADQRTVLYGGFGNGDSHQTINSFIWSPGGELYFGHGDGCESRVETPWGVSGLFNAGYYHMRPRRGQLIPFLEGHMSAGNPWGAAFDRWGQVFGVIGAGGVSWLTAGLVATTHRKRLKRIGNPGGYCGVAYVESSHLPDALQHNFLLGDFKPNRVSRFTVRREGAGFGVEWKEPLLKSSHRNFRPVDVRVGPDGAVYVVDWYNPITCHQDDAYRHPNRDKAHGRIWRVSSDRPALQTPQLAGAPLPAVVQQLESPEYWNRYHAKRELTNRDPDSVADALDVWVSKLDTKHKEYEFHVFQALGAYATIEVVRPALLNRLLNASKAKARSWATRLAGRWHDRLENPLELLAARTQDTHPRVRLEAVIACSEIRQPESIAVAAGVLDSERDEWIDYAFEQAVHALRPQWQPALQAGQLSFSKPQHLAAVLNRVGGGGAVEQLRRLVRSGNLDAETRTGAVEALLAAGSNEDILEFALSSDTYTNEGDYNAEQHAAAMAILTGVASSREAPENVGNLLKNLFNSRSPHLRQSAINVAAEWQLKKLGPDIHSIAVSGDEEMAVREAAFHATARLDAEKSRALFTRAVAESNDIDLKAAVARAWTNTDLDAAADVAMRLFQQPDLQEAERSATLQAFLSQSGGAEALAKATAGTGLSKDSASALIRSMFAAGRSDQSLFTALSRVLGASLKTPDYSSSLVSQLVSDSNSGNVERGRHLFQSMACASCHRISGNGGDIGPDLTAIGTTLSKERIVEEVMWPARQVKEGYSMIVVVTSDGRVHTGIERAGRGDDNRQINLLDPVTKQIQTIPVDEIEERKPSGSPMPAGLTSLLTKQQRADLLAYLVQLGRVSD